MVMVLMVPMITTQVYVRQVLQQPPQVRKVKYLEVFKNKHDSVTKVKVI